MTKVGKKQKQSVSTDPAIDGYTDISVWCDKFPSNSVGLKFIWMQFPSLCIPQIGDKIDIQEWDDEIDDRFYIVKERDFVFVGKNEFDSIRLTVDVV